MLRRLLIPSVVLLVAAGLIYAGLFAVLYRVQWSGLPLVHGTNKALKWKGGNSYQKFREYDPDSSFQVVFLGSSHAYRGYDPRIFTRAGHSAFNLGTSAQSLMNSRVIAETFLNSANTDLLVLDMYEAAFEMDGLESTADLSQNITVDLAALRMCVSLRDPRGLNMLALRLAARNAPARYVDSTYVTAGYSLTTDSVKGRIHYVVGRPLAVEEEQLDHLEAIIRFCREGGIPLVLVNHPYPEQSDRAKHEAFNVLLRERIGPHGVPYLDFAYDHGLPLDDRDHFYDHNHLNQAGVELFNPLLIERLRELGLLAPSGLPG
ncbi:MAG: SGNH/GDSL hydrolase family protein [Flavobacteriales bacterium]|nr:SGNH/GDSL hydrolase family protein [Flavobacteriales bacterium]